MPSGFEPSYSNVPFQPTTRAITNADVLIGAHIDVLVARVALHHKNECVRVIVDMKKLAAACGCPRRLLSARRAPSRNGSSAASRPQRARPRIVVVSGTVEIGGHR